MSNTLNAWRKKIEETKNMFSKHINVYSNIPLNDDGCTF